MEQITEISDLVIHGVALVDRISEDIDPRIVISTSMKRLRGLYPWFRYILSVAGVSKSSPEH